MKNSKLKLEDLKVKSFVTSMEKAQKQTIDGGITPTILPLASITASIVSNITKSIIDNYTNQSCVIYGDNTEFPRCGPVSDYCSVGSMA